jgi:hypothetical protein
MCIKKKGLPPPNNLVDITNAEIFDILKQSFPQSNIFIGDSIYSTTSIDELMRFLKDDKTNEYRYISEYRRPAGNFDCEDFSFRLLGQIHSVEWGALPLCAVWITRGHALNCFIDDKHMVWMIEPQTDEVYRPKAGEIPYFILVQ